MSIPENCSENVKLDCISKVTLSSIFIASNNGFNRSYTRVLIPSCDLARHGCSSNQSCAFSLFIHRLDMLSSMVWPTGQIAWSCAGKVQQHMEDTMCGVRARPSQISSPSRAVWQCRTDWPKPCGNIGSNSNPRDLWHQQQI